MFQLDTTLPSSKRSFGPWLVLSYWIFLIAIAIVQIYPTISVLAQDVFAYALYNQIRIQSSFLFPLFQVRYY